MKKLSFLILIVILLLMLVYPNIVMEGARHGLLLWFNTLLPTLLPFMIITNFLYSLNMTTFVNKTLSPLLTRVFHIPYEAVYPVFIGCIAGIPVGASLISRLLSDGMLSKREAERILLICSNPSVSFITGYLFIIEPHSFISPIPALLIMILSSYLSSAIIDYFSSLHYSCAERLNFTNSIFTKGKNFSLQRASSSEQHSSFSSVHINSSPTFTTVFDSSVIKSLDTITRVGGYVIIFSAAASMIIMLLNTVILYTNISPETAVCITAVFSGFLEITTGTGVINSSSLITPEIKMLLMLSISSFGGLSGILQVNSQINDSGISCMKYFIGKLLNSALVLLSLSIILHFTK